MLVIAPKTCTGNGASCPYWFADLCPDVFRQEVDTEKGEVENVF